MAAVAAWVSFVFAVGVAPSAASQTNALIQAEARVAEFDLPGAVKLLEGASQTGDVSAWVPAVYVRGLIQAHDAARAGGSPDSLAPVRQAIAWLEVAANGRPGSAEVARLVLQAAAAAAQSEREEMRLYLDTAIRTETLQRAAGLPGAPLVSAAEIAGDLWLQVHRYDEARRAYDEAAQQVGTSLRILSGRARAARGANDPAAACRGFRTLIEAWGSRSTQPAEIDDARAYIAGSCEVK